MRLLSCVPEIACLCCWMLRLLLLLTLTEISGLISLDFAGMMSSAFIRSCGTVCADVGKAVRLGVLLEGPQPRPLVAGEVDPGVAAVAADPVGGHLLAAAADCAPVARHVLGVGLRRGFRV